MIFWIASYPKSGNTWLRALISSYYFSQDGVFNESIIKKIGQFPEKRHFINFEYNPKITTDTCRFWIKAQERINSDKKLHFFKTHNILGKINNSSFTNSANTIGCIYIIRDPRNVITSLKNHYQLDDNQALNWMQNKNNFIYDVFNHERDGFSDFQFISSWNINYKSWKDQNKIPVKIIRYEDLLKETFLVFKDIVKFINITINSKETINIDRIKKSVQSTFFEKLKDNEKKNGFTEAVFTKDKKEKIPFFYLGPKNDWKKILNKELRIKIEEAFKAELNEIGY